MNTVTEKFTAGETVLLEKDYDEKTWSVVGQFDSQNPDHFADGQHDRTSYELSESDAKKLNQHFDGDGFLMVHVSITKKGLRVFAL